MVLGSLALACGSLLAVSGSYAYLTQGQVRLARLQVDLARQGDEQRQLELRVSELEQPSNVMSRATHDGLVTPSKVTDLQQVSTSVVSPAPAGAGHGR